MDVIRCSVNAGLNFRGTTLSRMAVEPRKPRKFSTAKVKVHTVHIYILSVHYLLYIYMQGIKFNKYIYMSVCTCIAQDRAHLTQVLTSAIVHWNTGCCLDHHFEESPFR